MASEYIINVSESDFENEVLAYSQQTPVVVDFWAEWCRPCKILGPILERLANEAQGSFRLAKVNVDENQNLAVRFGIHSIPAVRAFRNGNLVAEFSGLQPEPRLRDFLRTLAPGPTDLELEKGFSLLSLDRAEEAEAAFRTVLDTTPDHPAALLGLAKSLLKQGISLEALPILEHFPASREYQTAQTLLPLAKALVDMNMGEVFENEDRHDPAYFNALRLFKRGNIEAAMDGYLDILREDRRYRDGLARLMMLAMLELLGDTQVTQQYRKELASVLF